MVRVFVLLLLAALSASAKSAANDDFGTQLIACIDSKGVGQRNDSRMQTAIRECNKSVHSEMSILYHYGESQVSWLTCVQKNAKANDSNAGFIALGSCKKEYQLVSKFEAILDDVGAGLKNAQNVLSAAMAGRELTISNPFPLPKRLP
jgi:hypothetical protein